MFPPNTGLNATVPQFREKRGRPNHSIITIGARLNIAPYAIPREEEDSQSISGVVVFLAKVCETTKRSDTGMNQKHRRTPRECLAWSAVTPGRPYFSHNDERRGRLRNTRTNDYAPQAIHHTDDRDLSSLHFGRASFVPSVRFALCHEGLRDRSNVVDPCDRGASQASPQRVTACPQNLHIRPVPDTVHILT